jgi:hypothetical protein
MTKLARWRKSSHSNDSATCIELCDTLDAVRDSKHLDGPTLTVAGLPALVDDIKTGRFDAGR